MERTLIQVRGVSNGISFNGSLDEAKKTVETVMESFLVPSICEDTVRVILISTPDGVRVSKCITVRGVEASVVKQSIQDYLNPLK